MKILVTENQLQRILREDDVLLDVIKEQLQAVASNQPTTAQVVQNTAPAGIANAPIITLENEINKLIGSKQTEILNGASIWIDGTPPDLVLHIGNTSVNLVPSQTSKNVFFYSLESGSKMTFGGINMNEILPQIEKMKEYQELSQSHPEIKAQLQKGPSVLLYVAEGEKGNFIFRQSTTPPIMNSLSKGEDDKKEGEIPPSTHPFGTKYPLGEFFETNKLVYVMGKTKKFRNREGQIVRPKTVYGELESGGITIQLMGISLKPEQKPPQNQGTIKVSILSLKDCFNFDNITFINPAQTNQQINAFVQDMKQKISQYGAPFVKHIQSQNPTIIGYSSIDGDPNEQINGKYQPCSGYKVRKQYDYCLSGQRAKVIADMLNKALPDLGNAFKSESGGETAQFGNKLGWTPQRKTIPDDTKDNRVFFLKPIQPYVATV